MIKKRLSTLVSIVMISSSIQAEVIKQQKPEIKKILLVVAMNQEAQPIIKSLDLHPSRQMFSRLPMRSYTGHYANKEIFLIKNGTDPIHGVENIGTQPATLSTYLGIERFQPDLVISIGTAGGMAQAGAKIGDVYVSQKIYFYDRRSPQKGYADYGHGAYPSYPVDKLATKLHFKKGRICTGDSFDISPTDLALILKHQCAAVEMEAAAIAWVSQQMNTPMVAIKGIGDIVGKSSEKQYAENSITTQNHLGKAIEGFISSL